MTIKLQPEEVNGLIRSINQYFDSYEQYEDFFASAGISFYLDPRESGKKKGFTHEFSKRADHELFNMLSALKLHIREYQTKKANVNQNKSASIALIEELINKYFPGMSGSLIPAPSQATEAVQVACDEANRLISEGKYPEAIDRVHTFFQGYIRHKCSQWQIEVGTDSKIKDALLLIIDKHRYFTELNTVPELKNVLRSLANMCDRFDAFRNNMSLAHPTGSLLASNEAKLMINIIRSLYEYLQNIGENEGTNQSARLEYL